MKKRDVEVLFCFEPYDELVLLQLREFDRKHLTSVEKDMRQSSGPEKSSEESGILYFFNTFSQLVLSLIFCSHRYQWTRQQIN